jgi:hypothetical protein
VEIGCVVDVWEESATSAYTYVGLNTKLNNHPNCDLNLLAEVSCKPFSAKHHFHMLSLNKYMFQRQHLIPTNTKQLFTFLPASVVPCTAHDTDLIFSNND